MLPRLGDSRVNWWSRGCRATRWDSLEVTQVKGLVKNSERKESEMGVTEPERRGEGGEVRGRYLKRLSQLKKGKSQKRIQTASRKLHSGGTNRLMVPSDRRSTVDNWAMGIHGCWTLCLEHSAREDTKGELRGRETGGKKVWREGERNGGDCGLPMHISGYCDR